MSDMGNHAKLTDGQRHALYFAVAVVVAGMAMGFVSSFTTLYGAASAHAWTFPWLLPLAVDSGILAYVVLDHLAVTLGARSRWLHLAAWALAAFTVWANAAVSPADGTVWRVIHAAMPALWVLGVEALRYTWRRLHDVPQATDSIPRGRWLAAPWPTLKLWRRMYLANITDYPRAVELENARLHARDLLRAAREADPELTVPAALKRAVRTGRLPATVTAEVDSGMMFGGATRWEPEVASWITSRLTLPDRLAAQLRNERAAITREAAPDPIPEVPAATPPQALPAAPQEPPADTHPAPRESALRKVRRIGGRKATDDDIREAIRELFADGNTVTVYRVVKELKGPKGGIADKRAGRLLAEVQAEHPHLLPVPAVR